MTVAITITKTNRDLWGEFFDLHIEGVEQHMPLEKKAQKNGERLYKITLNIASTIALGLLINWLSDKINSHPEGETKIENKAVTQDHGQITNIIMEHVTINNYYSEKQPDDERIPQE